MKKLGRDATLSFLHSSEVLPRCADAAIGFHFPDGWPVSSLVSDAQGAVTSYLFEPRTKYHDPTPKINCPSRKPFNEGNNILLLANRDVRFYWQVMCPLAFGFSFSSVETVVGGAVGKWKSRVVCDFQAQRLFHSSPLRLSCSGPAKRPTTWGP